MRIRLARPSDAESIRSLYNEEVLKSTATFDVVPRTVEEQARWMADHQGPHPAIVATDELDGSLVGFGSLSYYRDRHAYATTVENSVYVAGSRRRTGVGRSLLAELVGLAEQHGFHSLIARVGDDNSASIGLHRAYGFELVGVEREIGRKFNRWLDVSVLQLML